jgi:hypothetical protein
MAKDAVVSLGISDRNVITLFDATSDGKGVLVVGYLATHDPNTHPTEFNNQLNQVVFAVVDAFVRADSAPVFLSVEAFAIQGESVVPLGGRAVHRMYAVDWWNGWIGDAAFIAKMESL